MNCAGSLEEIVSKHGTLTHEETCRALRLSIAAEYDAVALYEKIAERTDDPLVKKVMLDVVEEEKVHAGEFLEALRKIEPSETKHYGKGAREVKEMGESKLSPKFSEMLRETKAGCETAGCDKKVGPHGRCKDHQREWDKLHGRFFDKFGLDKDDDRNSLERHFGRKA